MVAILIPACKNKKGKGKANLIAHSEPKELNTQGRICGRMVSPLHATYTSSTTVAASGLATTVGRKRARNGFFASPVARKSLAASDVWG